MLKWKTTSTQRDIHCSQGWYTYGGWGLGSTWEAYNAYVMEGKSGGASHGFMVALAPLSPRSPLRWLELLLFSEASDVRWEWSWCYSQRVSNSLEQSLWLFAAQLFHVVGCQAISCGTCWLTQHSKYVQFLSFTFHVLEPLAKRLK